MPNYVIYNPSSAPVVGRVTNYVKSFPKEREAELGPNILIDPDITGIDLRAAKVSGGVLQNLTAQEISDINAAAEASEKAAVKAAAKSIFISPDSPEHQAIKLGFQTFAEMMVSELNILRANQSLAPRTNTQLNNAFKSAYEAKIDAL